MKSNKYVLLVALLASFYSMDTLAVDFNRHERFFLENKGQVKDQNGNNRNDIQYILQDNGISVFIGNGQLHYQFIHNDISQPLPNPKDRDFFTNNNADLPKIKVESYRMDVALEGANPNASVVAEDAASYYENYYLSGCPDEGIHAHAFRRITYKNVYDGVDWVIYISGNNMEHEFVVKQGADASKIKLVYNGQTSLNINTDGSITAVTPMGIIHEQAPVCYRTNGDKIASSYQLKGNKLSFAVKAAGQMVIDPEVEWGTYYGPDTSSSPVYSAVCDNMGAIYICGLTYAGTTGTIATTGGYQATYMGNADGYLAKFDSSGHRLWGTYYGGTDGDWSTAVACDGVGNVYVVGATHSTTGIATTGCQQPTYGGGLWDAFLVKFNTDGIRRWGTYYGGSSANIPNSAACDNLGHVYIAGITDDNDNIATIGSFKAVKGGGHELFMAQFDTLGVRQWGTYYGGNSDEFGGIVCTDGTYSYLTGYTYSTTNIGTGGTHQPALSGASDAFLGKFTVTGTRLWGTYYGGDQAEWASAIISSGDGIYILGVASSDTGIATTGCDQPRRGGVADAFLAKFYPETGELAWGTYFGGPNTENTELGITADDSGNVYIGGITSSTTGIATPDAWQTAYGGGDEDGFFVKYHSDGARQWSTYYGGELTDEASACAYDGRNVYLCGKTSSSSHIATSDGFLPTGGGGAFYYQGFIAKFAHVSIPVGFATPEQNRNVTLYPNPNNGSFTISGKVSATATSALITVTDITGRVVTMQHAAISNGSISQQVRSGLLSPGTYFVKVSVGSEVSTLQFVVR